MVGLYAVLWGKYKEYKDKEAEEMMDIEAVKKNQNGTVVEDIEANINVEIQRNEGGSRSSMSLAAVAISGPVPMLAIEAPKA